MGLSRAHGRRGPMAVDRPMAVEGPWPSRFHGLAVAAGLYSSCFCWIAVVLFCSEADFMSSVLFLFCCFFASLSDLFFGSAVVDLWLPQADGTTAKPDGLGSHADASSISGLHNPRAGVSIARLGFVGLASFATVYFAALSDSIRPVSCKA